MTLALTDNMNEWIGNHPQVLNSPISNNIVLVPDHNQPGKKIRCSKLLLQISIREIHNDLISEIFIYQFKEAIDESKVKTLISDTSLRAIIPKNVGNDRQVQTYAWLQNMCYYLLHARITKLLLVGASKPIIRTSKG